MGRIIWWYRQCGGRLLQWCWSAVWTLKLIGRMGCNLLSTIRWTAPCRLFFLMGLAGDLQELWNVAILLLHDTVVGSSIKRWFQWCGNSLIDLLRHFNKTDSPYVSDFEDVKYKRLIDDILRRSEYNPCTAWLKLCGKVIESSHPYNRIGINKGWFYHGSWPRYPVLHVRPCP